jgi:outer membrane lipoprotein LolB
MIRLLAFVGMFFLSGCASLEHRSRPPAQPEFAPFLLHGRIAVNYRGEKFATELRWTHQTQSDEILLLAPLGKTVARITRDAKQATLAQGERHYHAENVEALMTELLGWYLPLDSLHHWVLGLPASGNAAQSERNEYGQISRLKQDDWEVSYTEYADTRADSLPKRLEFSRAELRVKLVIDGWEWVEKKDG